MTKWKKEKKNTISYPAKSLGAWVKVVGDVVQLFAL